ncbi:phenylalanine--tRNA ligase subunit beta [Salisediminibacterium selenitireducens]|uniref:Phenylalanine--tRNA ligase beta subunit n=1 Tax=Bacillus selenitireducens (strain ATCC 700615 / DSM 15326 / MLS10) TaxID=439292 RepID=D6XSV8_BACIE|nr:phenylalanine--tRNA ligase subunit beta [Salisediminibacterium selenitireducens]ADH98894.1 phenylalanyl-tRNA synthetase, beta subunit [[Bacillus] selenitireducens MLS10]
MLVSYKWLKRYVNLDDVTPEEVAEQMTRSGIEVDSIEKKDAEITKLQVGKVLSCEKHPDADKLNVCQVDVGEEEPVQIVCGAANVGADQFVAVSRVGGRLPGGMKIKRAKLRGVVSEGMICSLQELGFEGKVIPKKYAEGIYNFPNEYTPGEDAVPLLGLDDTILELDLTPNRSDALSMLGVAYEVAAIFDRDVRIPETPIQATERSSESMINVHVANTADNPYYGATVIEDVTIEESPLWLQSALMMSGVRPLNNIVDITNYVLFEYGQPLHAFDLDQFGSSEVSVRRAYDNEVMKTLDDQERKLSPEHLVITNGTTPVALAGVMGGADSEVSDQTGRVLLEAAYFNPAVVRQASRELGIRSDSSIRFEKGVDPNRVEASAARAAGLIQDLAGGTVLLPEAKVDELNRDETVITITLEKINSVLGTSLIVSDVLDVMRKLKFDVTENGETFTVNVPTRRQDIAIQADIIEEVARIYGYDQIPTTLPNTATTPGKLTPAQEAKRKARRYLEGAGLSEAVSYSLTTKEKEEALGFTDAESRVRVSLPMSEDRSALRTTLVPHLVDALRHNKNRNNYDVHLFEIGSVFHTSEAVITKQPDEKTYLSAAFMGKWFDHAWQGEVTDVDFFAVKGVLEGLLSTLNVENVELSPIEKEGCHPGRTAAVHINGEEAGFIGQLHPAVAKDLSLPDVYVFELQFDRLMAVSGGTVKYEAIPRFPSVERDIALVVNRDIQAGEIERTIQEAGGSLLKQVNVFDLYEGEHLEAGKKSIAFSLRYLDPAKTLTEEDVQAVHDQVLKAVHDRHEATLRQ